MTLRPVLFLLLAAVLAGCAGPRVQPVPVVREHPLIGEARALAREQQALHGPARRAAAGRIEALLSQLDDATLAREAAALPAGDPLYAFAGRALLNRGLPLPRPFDRSQWKLDSADWPPAERDGYRPPAEVALLLPLSGSQATVAAAVRDGYLAGYYDETRRRPQLRFYDTAAAGGAGAALARAVADGADLVVGPLAREEVDAVFGGREPPLPVLALNRGEHLPPAGDASFSLSPEDEGVAAAEFLLERGARRVLVVAGGEDVQQRAARRGLVTGGETQARRAAPPPTARNRNKDPGLGGHAHLLLIGRQLNHGPIRVRITKRGEDLPAPEVDRSHVRAFDRPRQRQGQPSKIVGRDHAEGALILWPLRASISAIDTLSTGAATVQI